MDTACSCSRLLLPAPRPPLCESWRLAVAVPHATGSTAAAIPDNYPYHHHPHHLSGRKKINTKDMHFVSQITQEKFLKLYIRITMNSSHHVSKITHLIGSQEGLMNGNHLCVICFLNTRRKSFKNKWQNYNGFQRLSCPTFVLVKG